MSTCQIQLGWWLLARVIQVSEVLFSCDVKVPNEFSGYNCGSWFWHWFWMATRGTIFVMYPQ